MNIQHVIDLLNRAELYDESSAVLEMMEQNRVLLEALKRVGEMSAYPMAAKVAKTSIKKAEVLE